MADYNSEYTGQQIDDAVGRLITSADNWDGAITAAQEAASDAQTAVNAAAAAYQYINTNFAKVTESGLLEYDNSRVVYFDAMIGIDGSTDADVLNLTSGSTYYKNGVIYTKSTGSNSSGRPNTHTIYISKNTLKNYRWTGSSMQEIQGSGHGFDSVIYTAIKNNMGLLQSRLDRLISDLATMAFQSTATGYKTGVGELTWPDVTQNPLLFIRYNGYNVNGLTVNVTANASGTTTIPLIVKTENIDTGDDFTVTIDGGNSLTVPNTVSFSQAKSSNGAALNITYGQTGETSTTLTVIGNGLSATVIINIAEAGTATYTVSGTLVNCTIDGQSSVNAQVTSGGTWSGTLVANSGFSLPEDIENDIITSGTAESVSLVGSTLTIANITSNISFSITATSNQQATSYITDNLVLHLDGKNQGDEENCWTDTIGGKKFVLYGNPVVTSDGVTFSTASTEQYGWYSDRDWSSWLSSSFTIEVCFTPNADYSNDDKMVLFGNRVNKGIGATFFKGFGFSAVKIGEDTPHNFKRALLSGEAITSGSPMTLSMNVNLSMLNGVANRRELIPTALGYMTSPLNIGMMVGGTNRSATPSFIGCNATIHEVRIYSTPLSEAQMRNNQQYDNIRYNLELSI